MGFLVRLPLVQFSVSDESDIYSKWNYILEAISLSSDSFYKSIRNKYPDQLSKRERITLYKYLLRGKYRPTPFGLWAGTGIGKWEEGKLESLYENKTLIQKEIKKQSISEKELKVCLNPSLEKWGDGWKFWNFDFEKEVWRYSKVIDNLLVQRIRELSLKEVYFGKIEFKKAFPELVGNQVDELWEYLVNSQLVTPSKGNIHILRQQGSNISHTDIFITNKFKLDKKIKNQLDNFLDEIDSIAVFQKRELLEELKSLFFEYFDDRFVPLQFLWTIIPYLNLYGHHSKIKNENNIPKKNWEGISQIDLKNEYLNLEIKNKEIHHKQVLFRCLEDGRILIDNIVYNRPFVYSGRFSYQEEIKSYFEEQKSIADGVIYADVLLFEGEKENFISNHINLFSYCINVLSESSSDYEFDIKNLHIGIVDNEIKLYCSRLKKEVIPVIQHPLNPDFISHPLCRILWEVSHQYSYKPIFYVDPMYVAADYLPQINWGQIIIQPKRWLIRKTKNDKSQPSLREYLEQKKVPNRVLIGNLDQELLLDLGNPTDFEILEKELEKKRVLTLTECLWINDEDKTSESLEKNFPQYIWGKPSGENKEIETLKLPVNLACIDEGGNWVYFRIFLIPDFHRKRLTVFLQSLSKVLEKDALDFFYLYYFCDRPEIRLRIKCLRVLEKEKIRKIIYEIFFGFSESTGIKESQYFPEIGKFSSEGLEISEHLFCLESKLVANLIPEGIKEKLSLVVGIGLEIFRGLKIERTLLKKSKISSLKENRFPVFKEGNKFDMNYFETHVSEEWRFHYYSKIKTHPWSTNTDKASFLGGNHFHLLINRVFLDQASEFEELAFDLLSKQLRKTIFKLREDL